MKPRINIYDQIGAFYSFVFENQDKVDKSHIALYMFLINQNNRSNWTEWFKLPFDLAMGGACIGSKSTYYKCLNDLQSWKLIKYKKGLNEAKAPMISIIVLSKSVPLTVPLSEPLTEQLTVPLTEQLTVPLSEQLSVLLTGNINRLITDNYKLITDNIIKWIKSELELNDRNSNSEILEQKKFLFDQFWSAYDKKLDRDGCFKLWMKIDVEIMDQIIDHAIHYKDATPDKQFRKHPKTYLNNKCWNDEIIKTGNNGKLTFEEAYAEFLKD